ncbi:MAG: DUF3795 domain-containing protein [Methanobacteriaceae archaeon]
MKKVESCCGVVCSDCEWYPKSCLGCPSIQGKAFWTKYLNKDICDIYQCCINEKKYKDCGECKDLPCEKYNQKDLTKTKEENQTTFNKQIENLKNRINP